MIHYNKFIQILQNQNIVLQYCSVDQVTSSDFILAYQVSAHRATTITHELYIQEQKIYIFVEQGADCKALFFERIRCDSFKLDLHVVIAQDGQCAINFSFVNTLNIDCSINIYLEGDRAKADIKGLYALDGNQKVLIKTFQYHAGVDTYSNLVIKGMLAGKAQASYHGLIKIDESAKKADASQENKNIVLSPMAHVVSIPSIEVLQHDVQCCHGSAIGKFDQTDMWYLQSKGIVESQAQALLVRSFFQDVLTGLDNRDEIMDMICQKMK